MTSVIGKTEWIPIATLVLLAVVGIGLSVFLVRGLFNARSLFRREFSAYFLSPIAYVVMVVFLAVTGHLFYLTLQLLIEDGPGGIEYPMQPMLGDERFWLVFLFIPPLLTMRLFAEERSTGTLEMLMTTPLRDWQVVLSKYFACFGFYLLLWLPTLIYLPVLLDLQQPIWRPVVTAYSILWGGGMAAIIVSLVLLLFPFDTKARAFTLVLLLAGVVCSGIGGWCHYHLDVEHVLQVPSRIDPMPVLTSYLGLALAGAMFLALGLLVSSLVRSQMVAALISLILSLVFVVAGFWRPEMDTSKPLYQVLYFFSVPLHFYRDFSRGLIDSRHVVLYGSVAFFCLFMTVRSLETRRWR